jgi:sarcosine oxidase
MSHRLQNDYDVIVLGLGGVGSAAIHALSRRCSNSTRLRVLGLDQYRPPHPYGSSHGETRIIRKSYFEHPDYVPLLVRAYALWRELEVAIGRPLYDATGLLEIGPADGLVVPGVLRSAEQHGLPIEIMSMHEGERRFPGIRGNADWTVLLERDAGYLRVEACIEAQLQRAEQQGASLAFREVVAGFERVGRHIVVRTSHRQVRCERLIVAAGPWADTLLKEMQLPLRVLLKHLYWYGTADAPMPASYDRHNGFPCFFYETSQGYFYGFPASGTAGMKVARHSGGTSVSVGDPRALEPETEDQSAVEGFLREHLPGVPIALQRWSPCYYTMTPDEHFIVDRCPIDPALTVVAGLSGHGFKFTSVLGELACELALGETPSLNIDFLRLSRFERPVSEGIGH